MLCSPSRSAWRMKTILLRPKVWMPTGELKTLDLVGNTKSWGLPSTGFL